MGQDNPAQHNSNGPSRGISRLLEWMHRHFLWLLGASYVLAAFQPGPGLAIRRLSWGTSASGKVTAPMLLLALLLFCAATVVRGQHVRQLLTRPSTLVWGLVSVWLIPGLYVSLVGWILPWAVGESLTGGLLVGLALVAAMPVANSSVAWTQNSRGNVALGLGMIVLTILLSPLATPQMLQLMGLSLSEQDTHHCRDLVQRFSGTFFIVWVILPSAAGLLFNRLVGQAFIERIRTRIRFVSALALLTLNYTNASLAMPALVERERPSAILVAAILAVSLQVLGVIVAWTVAAQTDLDDESAVSLMYAFSMKHTGLALVLAGEVLQTEPRAILLIVLATLLQHMLAGLVDWGIARRRAGILEPRD